MLTEPAVVCSPWTLWCDWSKLRRESWGGVYLFGCFGHPPAHPPDPAQLPREVAYIGETKDLNGRPLTAHNRVGRYREVLQDRRGERLFVPVAPLYRTGCSEYLNIRAFAVFIEAKLDWQYTQTYGIRPALHFKEERKRA